MTKAADVTAEHRKPEPLALIHKLADEEPPRAHRTFEDQDSTTSRLLASFMNQAEDDQMFDAERLAADAELNH